MMDFLQLSGKHVIVFGVANRKSVAYHIGATLEEIGARVIYVVQNEARRQQVAKLLGDAPVYVCDVEFEEQIRQLRQRLHVLEQHIEIVNAFIGAGTQINLQIKNGIKRSSRLLFTLFFTGQCHVIPALGQHLLDRLEQIIVQNIDLCTAKQILAHGQHIIVIAIV